MTDTTKHPEGDAGAVAFSRLTRRGVILGLSLPQVITLAAALATVVAALYLHGGLGVAYTAPVWAGAAAVTWIQVAGRSLVEWAPIVVGFGVRALARQLVYRRRVVTPRPVGTLALPGDAAPLRECDDPLTGAVMVHDPHRHTLTVTVQVSPPSFVLLEPDEHQRRVASWSRALAGCCRSGRLARVQVLVRSVSDSGGGLARWWREHGRDDGSWVARTYSEVIERAGPAADQHLTTVSLALDMKAAGRVIRSAGGGLRGAAHVLRQEMTTLASALRSAELQPAQHWYTPGELAVSLRTAYDPAVIATLARHGAVGRDLATAGPVAIDETWESLRSDSAWHTVLWISEWPRSPVGPTFLAPLLLAPQVRRTFSLLCEPIRPDRAARDIRRAKTEHIADRRQRARIGQIEDAATDAEYRDVLRQEIDLAAGHGVTRFVGLIAVSAPTVEQLEAAVAETEQAAVQAGCETRRLWGQQAQAFTAAALPLCRTV